jgi:asparagine synthase (glutamine-hydrolysing)
MGKQPMSDASGRYWIAFNGEIYNYVELRERLVAEGCRFETSSDTEVLLQALIRWGEDALPLIDGQFALLLYDRLEKRVLAARDPYGERPLHYAAVAGGVAFASEIKSLFVLPEVSRALDERSVGHAFHFWTMSDRFRTICCRRRRDRRCRASTRPRSACASCWRQACAADSVATSPSAPT